MDSEDDFSPSGLAADGLQQNAQSVGLAPEIDRDDEMFDDSESSCHTMSTIASDHVANYFRSIRGFQYESNENVPYLMPIDSSYDKLDVIAHVMFRIARGGSNVSPVADEMLRSGGVDGRGGTPRVLEVITNSGTWAQEMAEIYPAARLVSIDTKPLVPHKPHARITYEVYELGAGIMEPDSSFDLVYTRNIERATKDINYLLREMHRVLKPNGILLIDVLPLVVYEGENPAVPLHSAVGYAKGVRVFRAALEQQGFDISMWDDLGSRLDPVHSHWGNDQSHGSEPQNGPTCPMRGFHSIICHKETLPMGIWSTGDRGKTLGELLRVFSGIVWRNVLQTMRTSNKEEEEAKASVKGALKELAEIDRYKLHQICQFWCAQKIEHF